MSRRSLRTFRWPPPLPEAPVACMHGLATFGPTPWPRLVLAYTQTCPRGLSGQIASRLSSMRSFPFLGFASSGWWFSSYCRSVLLLASWAGYPSFASTLSSPSGLGRTGAAGASVSPTGGVSRARVSLLRLARITFAPSPVGCSAVCAEPSASAAPPTWLEVVVALVRPNLPMVGGSLPYGPGCTLSVVGPSEPFRGTSGRESWTWTWASS